LRKKKHGGFLQAKKGGVHGIVVAWIFNSMFMPLRNHSCNPEVMESHAISK
jgi:hypothetical protein